MLQVILQSYEVLFWKVKKIGWHTYTMKTTEEEVVLPGKRQ